MKRVAEAVPIEIEDDEITSPAEETDPDVLRAIIRRLVEGQPHAWHPRDGGALRCFWCGAPKAEAHDERCAWLWAKKAVR